MMVMVMMMQVLALLENVSINNNCVKYLEIQTAIFLKEGFAR